MAEMDFISEANDKLEGFEEINGSTMSIPFVKLAQSLTPQKNPKKAEYIEGLAEGMFFTTPDNTVLGESFEAIILKFQHMYIEWLPNRGGFVAMHTPANAARLAVDKTFGKWKTAEGNELQEYYSYYVLIVGREAEGPVVLSLASASIKVAKEFNRIMTTQLMDNGQKALPYYLVFRVDANYVTKGENAWYMPKFTFVRYINEAQYKIIGGERLALPSQQVDYALIEDKQTPEVHEDEF